MEKKKAVRKVNKSVSIPLIWIGVDELPVKAVTHAYSQVHEDGTFVMTFGMSNPPPLFGSAKENREFLASLSGVTVTPAARLAMSETLTELVIKMLQ